MNTCFVTDGFSDVVTVVQVCNKKKPQKVTDSCLQFTSMRSKRTGGLQDKKLSVNVGVREVGAPLRVTEHGAQGVSSHAAADYLEVCYEHKLMQTEGRQFMHQTPEPGQATKTTLHQAQLCQGQSCSDIAVEGGDKKTTVRQSGQRSHPEPFSLRTIFYRIGLSY